MTSKYPLAKLTSAADPSGTVLFDFNNDETPTGICRVEHDNFSLGTPALNGDPDSIFPQYGPRTVSFRVSVRGSKSYAHGKISAAAKWLMRDRCWLMVQLASTMKPVWFRLYRPEPGDLSFDNVKNTGGVDNWSWSVALPAEPFAYGQRITLTSLAVNGDPAAATNPCFAQIPAVVGDAPAPARFRIAHSTAQTGRRHMLAVTPAVSTMTAPIVWQVGSSDGWTAGTDTGAATADAAYSGGSYRAVSFATTPGMATRLSGAAPAPLAPSRYKIMARLGRSDTSSTFQVQFGVNGGFTYKYNDPVSLTWPASTAAGHAAWIDLGEIRLPQGNPIPDLTGEPNITPDVAFQAARLSGTGSLIVDAFLVIPVESDYARTVFVDWASASPWTGILSREYIDSEIEAVYSRFQDTNAALTTIELPAVAGGFPVLVPGENNVLHYLEQTSPSRSKATFVATPDAPDQLASVHTFVISYQPRWLFIGDGS